MKLSQCMIVKNEEKNIERALSWGKDIVSEQIVVDSGSTDRTVELAQAMGAKVYHFEWTDDFSAAKNYAISQASGDWILFLDADEYFSEEDAKKIPPYIQKIKDVKIKKNKIDAIQCTLCDLNTDGSVKDIATQIRIFRNRNYIRYKGRIHESLVGLYNRELITVDVKDTFVIYHTGYAWTPQMRAEKMNRNIMLLRKELENDPDNAANQIYLAEALLVNKEHGEAVEYARRAIGKKDRTLPDSRLMDAYEIVLFGTCYQIMEGQIADDPEAVLEIYEEAAAFMPDDPEYDAIIGSYMYDRGRYENAARYLEQMLEKIRKKEVFNPSLVTGDMKSLYRFLVFSYEKLENYDKFFSYAVQALQIDSKQDELIETLLRYLTERDPATTDEIYQFLHQIYDLNSQKDVIYLMRMSLRIGNEELTELLKADLTEENKNQLFQN